jgi:hypothetical protein
MATITMSLRGSASTTLPSIDSSLVGEHACSAALTPACQCLRCLEVCHWTRSVLAGSAGTGKSTLGRLYGQVLKSLRLLSNGEFVYKVGQFSGLHCGLRGRVLIWFVQPLPPVAAPSSDRQRLHGGCGG